jgi:hypothetical protein
LYLCGIVPNNGGHFQPSLDFSNSPTSDQSAQITFVGGNLSPIKQHFIISDDQFNQLVGLVILANDYKTCTADIIVWYKTGGEVEATDTSDACAPVTADIQDLVDQLKPQQIY